MHASKSTKGFFTIAQNNNDTDYIRLAYGLALSLKHSQKTVSNLSIGITPGTVVDSRYKWAFDKIIEIPWNDNAADKKWKLENEWKSVWMSPYDETIKLDCDMLFFNDIQYWWNNLNKLEYPILCANRVTNWQGNVINNDYYRKTFTANRLPNVYSAFMYFKKHADTYEFFELFKIITWNWEKYHESFLEPQTRPEYFSTDVAIALALKILDLGEISSTQRLLPTFTHMKSNIQGWDDIVADEDWRVHAFPFMNADCVLKIGNHTQHNPLHYHIKDFLTDDMITAYENLVK